MQSQWIIETIHYYMRICAVARGETIETIHYYMRICAVARGETIETIIITCEYVQSQGVR